LNGSNFIIFDFAPQELLRKGAKLDHVNKDDVTALHWAAKKGHLKVVQELLSKGAKVDHIDREGWTEGAVFI
jgi:ankyrin repeat protein